MAKRLTTTPRQDGFWMPGEFEPQAMVFMLWPERPDNWRNGAKPAQRAFAEVAKAIRRFEPVTMCVSPAQYDHARTVLPEEIRVVEISSNDAWMRDVGPSFVVSREGEVRGVDWTFNAWGGLTDGLYSPWDQDDKVARKVCELQDIDSYRVEDFVLEGGSFHVDGEGTLITTEMCLLSAGRNPSMTKEEIEQKLKDYLGAEKVIWLGDGIDPEETNGHIDDMAFFVRPGEVACIYTEDKDHPFYAASHAAYETLCRSEDARGRRFIVHKLTLPKNLVLLGEDLDIDVVEGTIPRKPGDLCIASYANCLIVNGGVIVPQYDDENDSLALSEIKKMFPDREVVGVHTREVVYGGGNIHCITQQLPKARER